MRINKQTELTIDTIQGRSKYGAFPCIRIRTGKAKPKTILHFHAKHTPAFIDAIQAAYAAAKFSDDFYQSREWTELRYQVLKRDGNRCACCGSQERLHCDHIKPRSRYPELALEPSNLQVLCERCNLAKGNKDEIKW